MEKKFPFFREDGKLIFCDARSLPFLLGTSAGKHAGLYSYNYSDYADFYSAQSLYKKKEILKPKREGKFLV